MTIFSTRDKALSLVVGILVLGLAGATASPPANDDHQVLRATLSNGLKVVIVRNRLAPVVATAVNYLVGSDEAPSDFPGMAHAQEHMMFRGSPGLSADQLANIGSAMGGEFNANTRESLTQYLYTVPAEDLDVALNIEALRMQGVSDSEAEWDKERGAIEQEVAQDLSNPFYLLYQRLRMIVFAGTPYAHDALGTRPSFDLTTAQMLRSFHDAWYAPNNAILVIVGDIDPSSTLGRVKKLFGGIPPKPLPKRPAFKFQPLLPTSISLTTDRPDAAEVIAMRMPGLDSPDIPALEVLADILQSQRSELYGMVVQGKAIASDFSLDPLPKGGMGYAVISFPASGNSGEIAAQMRSILRKIADDGLPPELVEAAKLSERRQTEFQKNSIAELASVWSDAVALYGLPSPEADLARIQKVTSAEVNRVARKYLNVDHAVFATLVPKASGRPATSTGFGGQETIAMGEGKPVPLPSWANAALSRLQVPLSSLTPTVSHLANGLTLIVQPETVSDTVTIMGHVRNRPEIEEPPGKEGVSLMLDRLFSYGTEHLDRVAFQKALDRLGANERAGADFQIQVLAQDFVPGLQLLADNELHPLLPAQQLEVLKPGLTAEVAARNRSPGYLALIALRTALYSSQDPSLNQATADSIRSLSHDDVVSYYKHAFRPDLTTIVVIGHISADQAKSAVEKYFGSWSASGEKPETEFPPTSPNAEALISVPDANRVQDSVTLAQNLSLTRNDPDYYPLMLGNTVLGGGFYSTRLSIDLRKESGLVYTVSSELQSTRSRSAYLVRYASDPQNVDRAAAIVADEIADMEKIPVSVEELDRAKALLLRRIPLQEASIQEIARGYIQRVDLNLPLDEPTKAALRYLRLSPLDVQAAFRKWMRPEDLVRLSQGPTS